MFPPGAGGHFLWQMLTIHPKVMPMDKDQAMLKLFNDKTLQGQVERIKAQITTHDQWQKTEGNGYYVAPPDYSKNETADWMLGNNLVDVKTGDDYFFNKINKQDYYYGIVVHRPIQFPLLDQMKHIIGFDNFNRHIEASKGKISNIFNDIDYDSWTLDVDCFVFEPDKFYYDWSLALSCLNDLYGYLDLDLPKNFVDATQELWTYYRSHH